MWPQRWLGEAFAQLFLRHGAETFAFTDVERLLGSTALAKVAVSRLRRSGLAYVHAVEDRRRQYRLCDPDVLLLVASGRLNNLHAIPQGRYGRLLGGYAAELHRRGEPIRSVVVFGSAARGRARADSDLDVLIVLSTDASMGERVSRLSALEAKDRVDGELRWLYEHGIDTHVSALPFTRAEVQAFPPILLDIVADGIPLMDDGYFRRMAGILRARLQRVGARRVFLAPDEWYWDLKPGLRFGEVVTI
jgi:predicted nucleotidyltransferase